MCGSADCDSVVLALQKRFAELEAAQLLDAKAAKADGEVVADAKPLPAAVSSV